jgi:hypothetical protein
LTHGKCHREYPNNEVLHCFELAIAPAEKGDPTKKTDNHPNKMASPKKKATAKPSIKFKDLKANKNPKGGAPEIFLKIEGIGGESQDDKHKGEIY